jgi:hypothetical protein
VEPARVKKTRHIKNLEPRFDSIETQKAPVAVMVGSRRHFTMLIGLLPVDGYRPPSARVLPSVSEHNPELQGVPNVPGGYHAVHHPG